MILFCMWGYRVLHIFFVTISGKGSQNDFY